MIRLKYKTSRNGGYTLMDKGEIQAVHDDDLEILLKSLGVFEDIINGKKKCDFCDAVITLDNIQCVFPREGEICFCCTEEGCYRLLLERGDIND